MYIIAVDDEQPALDLLNSTIRKALPGESPVCFAEPEAALRHAEKNPVEVAFLDVEMKGMSGVDLARELIELYPKINIIFVTGYGQYMDKAFSLYASGYVRKPVRVQRIQKELSHLRYPLGRSDERFFHIGPLAFDHVSRQIMRDGEVMPLMPREYELFRLLAENPGVFFSADELYQRVWGQDSGGDARTIYSHMYRVRQKLDLDTIEGLDIEQQRGKGYRLKISSP